VQEPEEIEAEDHEQVAMRVAAIDVAKDSGMVCTRLPHPRAGNRRQTRVWEVESTTDSILEVAEHLASEGIERVVVESTSDYWRPFVYLLEARGLNVWLVNAQQVKQVPGRPKTDKLNAVWLAKLNERGMLRPSFIPPVEIRQLRDYTRLRIDLTHDCNRQKARVEKLLEDALIKLSSVASDIFGVSGRAMMEALIRGERDPVKLAALAKGRMRGKHKHLVRALTGRFDDHHAELLQILLGQIDSLNAKIEELTERIGQLITAIPGNQPPAGGSGSDSNPPPMDVITRLDEVAGIGPRAAQTIIAEIGLNMAQFPTAAHLVSWAKLAPRTIQSGSMTRPGAVGNGNPYLKGVLGEVAAAASKTDTFIGERYRRLVKRMGKLKALVAVARSILVIIWHLLKDPTARFRDLGSNFYSSGVNTDRKVRQLVHQLEALGHTLSITAHAA
jgi:transposase